MYHQPEGKGTTDGGFLLRSGGINSVFVPMDCSFQNTIELICISQNTEMTDFTLIESHFSHVLEVAKEEN